MQTYYSHADAMFNMPYNVTGGDDYDPGPYYVTFAVDSIIILFNLTIIDEGILEDNEVFSVSVASITNDHIVGNPSVTVVTIFDTTSKLHITTL